MPYLLDADWVINALGHKRGADAVLNTIAPDGISVSFITLAEVYEQAFTSPNPQAYLDIFHEFIKDFTLLSLTEPLMQQFAETRAQLRHQGRLIPDFDILLGVTAVHYDLTLLTFNIRHLNRIPNLRLYQHP